MRLGSSGTDRRWSCSTPRDRRRFFAQSGTEQRRLLSVKPGEHLALTFNVLGLQLIRRLASTVCSATSAEMPFGGPALNLHPRAVANCDAACLLHFPCTTRPQECERQQTLVRG